MIGADAVGRSTREGQLRLGVDARDPGDIASVPRIRFLLGDRHVVNVAFAQARAGDPQGAVDTAVTGLTALRVLETLAVQEGETVLVHAASGGVGHLATQLAVTAGATVVGTASPDNHEKVREAGGTPVEYGDGLEGRVRELAPDGVDAVADLVGEVLEPSLAVLREGGRIASIADPSVLEHGGQWVWVRPDGERLEHLLGEVAAGRLRVDIDRSFPLEDFHLEVSDEHRAIFEAIQAHDAGAAVARHRAGFSREQGRYEIDIPLEALESASTALDGDLPAR